MGHSGHRRNTKKKHVGCHSVAFLSVCFLLGNLMMARSFHFPSLESLTLGRVASSRLTLPLPWLRLAPGPGGLCSRHRDSKPTATQPMGPSARERCCVWAGPTHGCVDRVVRSPGPVQFRRAEEWESISATAVRVRRALPYRNATRGLLSGTAARIAGEETTSPFDRSNRGGL
ncbi:uncharacterized protein BDZ83DRAFT_467036 [Colletotrichum acutatum]|uniref:Uncharacterized protein n=1 Tax=Glomerella acutata TaxID=27357 RepID=A0AAD8UH95_GLOAC|nr:uncharacterized protein BDZ83DRAFT_467036 [Colletotrichum acutatum]KAK1718794.1 hypothetical protein BDZ83DRAFT_467036 [Colletotrichum acutatum]